jgi:hypothetical protein
MTYDNHLSFNLPSVSREKVTAAFDERAVLYDEG